MRKLARPHLPTCSFPQAMSKSHYRVLFQQIKATRTHLSTVRSMLFKSRTIQALTLLPVVHGMIGYTCPPSMAACHVPSKNGPIIGTESRSSKGNKAGSQIFEIDTFFQGSSATCLTGSCRISNPLVESFLVYPVY